MMDGMDVMDPSASEPRFGALREARAGAYGTNARNARDFIPHSQFPIPH